MAEQQSADCPFEEWRLDAAKDAFLSNEYWNHVYAKAPYGAKLRLLVSFFFSTHKDWLKALPDDRYEKYRAWRGEVERAMSDEDLEYMLTIRGNSHAVEHFASLLRGRLAPRQADPKLMSYDDFFAMLDEQGKFESFDYDDETKKGIVGDFLPVLRGSGDPLEEHLEDILATAKLKEVRVYPKDEIMYVRVEVKFLTDMAAWSRPCQMLAAWDCFNNLKGYVFPVGKGRRTRLPIELEDPPSRAQRKKRIQLMTARLAAAMKKRKGNGQ